MRSMSFFGLKNLLLIGYSGRKKPGLNKLHEKVVKTSLGAEKDVKVIFLDNSDELVEYALKNKCKLVVAEQEKKSININNWLPSDKMIVVFGNEVNGVSKMILDKADEVVEIKRLGKKGSLNVATAAGIVIDRLGGSVA